MNQGDSSWKQQIKSHYNEVDLNSQQLNALFENLTPKKPRSYFPWFTHGAVAVLAAGIGAFFVSVMTPELNDSFDEIASFSEVSKFPADFDLEGDAKALHQIVQDSFLNDLSDAEIPFEISQQFIPSEGRLFHWAGKSGVSIQLKSIKEGMTPATLYIVSLGDGLERSFPEAKTSKQLVQKSEKSKKKLNSWRKGKIGYALVAASAD